MSDFIPSGQNSDAKIVRYRPSDYEGEPLLYVLTQRQTSLLLAMTVYLRWKNRYSYTPEDLDTQEKINDYVDRLDNALMVEIEFCAFMIACIENDEDTKNALANLIVQLIKENQLVQQALEENRTQGGGTGVYQGANQTADLLQRTDCDDDKAAGNLLYSVNRAADRVLNLFEVIELNTDNDEMSVAFWDLIPILGAVADEFVIQDLKAYFDNVRNWMNDAFIAEDTPELREETAFDLLCIWRNNGCTISFDDMRDYFFTKATEANSGFNDALGTLVDLYNFLQGIETSFAGIWHVMMGVQFGHGWMIADMFGISLPQFKLMTKLGEPTDDWEVWESLYGPCICYAAYHRYSPIPNVPSEFEVSVGLIGIANILANSALFDAGGGSTSWIIGNFEIDVVNATGVQYVVDTPGQYSSEIYGSDSFFAANAGGDTVTIGANKYAHVIDWGTPFTGTLTIFNFRRHPIPETTPFKWLEFRVMQPC